MPLPEAVSFPILVAVGAYTVAVAVTEIRNWHLQPRFLRARYYLLFPDLRDSDASTLRTSDWEIPNCLAIRVGVIPALKVARTALTWPCVNATLGFSGCRRLGDSSVLVD